MFKKRYLEGQLQLKNNVNLRFLYDLKQSTYLAIDIQTQSGWRMTFDMEFEKLSKEDLLKNATCKKTYWFKPDWLFED